MKLKYFALSLTLLFTIACHAKEPMRNQLVNRVEQLVLAQTSFDPLLLDSLLSENFFEISPKGEYDSKDKVLSFYQPKLKTQFIPAVTLHDIKVDYSGNLAFITLREEFKENKNDVALFSMRATFTLKRVDNNWKFTYAQYTPIVAISRK